MTKEEFIDWQMNDWPRMQVSPANPLKPLISIFGRELTKRLPCAYRKCIYIQHFIGSLFCLPSILNLCDKHTASSLAICGVLSEMGWELQDMAEMFLVRALSPRGRLIWPDSIVAIFVIHHSLSTLLGLPMVLYYRDSAALHWICFDLQFAAAIALAVGEYTKILDIKEVGSLRQFKVLNGLALTVMVWTRIIHWSILSFELFVTWYRDAAWGFLCAGKFKVFSCAPLCNHLTFSPFTSQLPQDSSYQWSSLSSVGSVVSSLTT